MSEMKHAKLAMLEKFVDRLVFLGIPLTRDDVIRFFELACTDACVGARHIDVTQDPIMFVWGARYVLTNNEAKKRYACIQDACDGAGFHVGFHCYCVKDRSDEFSPAFIPLGGNQIDHVPVISTMITNSFNRV
jgi:hypothetical protein